MNKVVENVEQSVKSSDYRKDRSDKSRFPKISKSINFSYRSYRNNIGNNNSSRFILREKPCYFFFIPLKVVIRTI